MYLPVMFYAWMWSYRNNLNTLLDKFLPRLLRTIPSNPTNLVFLKKSGIFKDGIDARATLVAGGAEHSNYL